jgi:hypothetical protein
MGVDEAVVETVPVTTGTVSITAVSLFKPQPDKQMIIKRQRYCAVFFIIFLR